MAADMLSALKQLSPKGNTGIITGIAPFIEKYRHQYGVNTDNRLKHFLAQAAHETAGFKTLREYWGPTAAQIRYEGRTDLGNTQPGDGKKFMGRGIFQTTGRDNYRTTSIKIFGDERLLTNPELLEQYEWAVKSALIYWQSRKLNTIADRTDISETEKVKLITKKINGGYNGLQDRQDYFERIKNWVIKNASTATLLIVGIVILAGAGIYLLSQKS